MNTARTISLIELGASKWQSLRECDSSGATLGIQVSKYHLLMEMFVILLSQLPKIK